MSSERHLLPLLNLTHEEEETDSDCSSTTSNDEIVFNTGDGYSILGEILRMIDITTRMSISDESSDLDDFNDDSQQPASITASTPIISPFFDMQKVDDNNDRQSDQNKTKRRAWSTDEKLAAIKYHKAVKNYKQVAKEHGCSRKMIRTWASQEQNFLSLRGAKKGKNLKRLKGAGKKLHHVQLDVKLFEWFKTKQTPPEDEHQTTIIKKERITFRLLARQGAKICIGLNTVQPANKW
ncbi:unnamed protein product [Didymodactylos carnosus]|uniref:Brinker DNA-binding domain-containing protein n=1 Tax=Didymodactylos carnosus TaxID=1234261 RepID=A0A815BEQ0_9BILA|nr:unnamed protein product [Didymodactylos carnosus]CAF1268433.1 unnamed protein product [Didymodactylos carnosus]CAF3962327.1 unnamed protein product [Didymodactylos carnosus]CAF4053830.1 unnamed protein product [Didymodactylos carnosus]